MDWIEGFWRKHRMKIKNSSLRKSMVIYMILAVGLTIAAVGLTWLVCRSWKNVICQVNGIGMEYRYIGKGDFVLDGDIVITAENEIKELSKGDERLYETLALIQILCIPIYSVGAIILVTFVYYRNKLRKPIFLLKAETEAIGRNDLSFCCRYDSADEMGDICKSMDQMRCAVVENQQMMWELMEEQRKINAAFAHDLRTPLTVISGYVEMLLEYYPKGTVSEEQLLSMLDSIKGQTERMKVFSQTMKEVQGFEMLEIKKVKHTKNELHRNISNMAKGLEAESGLSISVTVKLDETDLYYDENVVMEVLGNLLSNALRYGKEQIQILVERQENSMFLYVKDDGRGMTKEELYKADSPYYSDKTIVDCGEGCVREKKETTHFGLGLTICKILCKKHGGGISLSNSVEGGAIVCARFLL